MSGDETITREELTAFCVRHKDYGVPTANAIWDDIKAHREPEYAQDDRVEDAEGVAWQRVPGDQWVRMGRAEWYDDDKPKRPLRKLVPEGSEAAVTPGNVDADQVWKDGYERCRADMAGERGAALRPGPIANMFLPPAKPTREQVRRALTVNGAEMWDETLLDAYATRIMKLLDGAE